MQQLSDKLSDEQIGKTITNLVKSTAKGIIAIPINIGRCIAIGARTIASLPGKAVHGAALLAKASTKIARRNPKTSIACAVIGGLLFARSNFARNIALRTKLFFMHQLLRSNNRNRINYAIRHGANINHRYGYNQTILHIAAQEGYNGATIDELIRRGASIEFDANGWSPIHYAAEHGHIEAADRLIQAGVDINLPTNNWLNRTPLHLAVLNNQLPMARWLIQHGADRQLRDQNGQNPAGIANLVADYNWAKGDYWNPQYPLEEMRLLFDRLEPAHNARLRGDNRVFTDLLIQAIETQNVLQAQAAINAGASLVDANQDNTPLLRAIGDYVEQNPTNLDEIAAALVRAGTPMNITDATGQTPLHYAARHGNRRLARLFLLHGAQIRAQDNRHLSSLDIALRANNLHMVNLLREHGAALTPAQIADNPWLYAAQVAQPARPAAAAPAVLAAANADLANVMIAFA